MCQTVKNVIVKNKLLLLLLLFIDNSLIRKKLPIHYTEVWVPSFDLQRR